MTVAKRKYYGCFNSILSVCGKHKNELASLHLIKSYCLPRLLYGCEGISFSSNQIHELDVIWNNAFRHIFNCCWRESVKPLQFYCKSMSLSYMIDERKLLFYRKLLVSNNVLIRTLMCVTGVYYDYVSLCSRYSILDPYCSRGAIGRAVWGVFADGVIL